MFDRHYPTHPRQHGIRTGYVLNGKHTHKHKHKHTQKRKHTHRHTHAKGRSYFNSSDFLNYGDDGNESSDSEQTAYWHSNSGRHSRSHQRPPYMPMPMPLPVTPPYYHYPQQYPQPHYPPYPSYHPAHMPYPPHPPPQHHLQPLQPQQHQQRPVHVTIMLNNSQNSSDDSSKDSSDDTGDSDTPALSESEDALADPFANMELSLGTDPKLQRDLRTAKHTNKKGNKNTEYTIRQSYAALQQEKNRVDEVQNAGPRGRKRAYAAVKVLGEAVAQYACVPFALCVRVCVRVCAQSCARCATYGGGACLSGCIYYSS